MKTLKWVGATLLTTALVACGGGNEAAPEQLSQLALAASAPAAVPKGNLLRSGTRSAAVSSLAVVSSPITATDLFNWAEQVLPAYFPGPQPDRSQPPFVYRYYPSTQVYLAVNGDLVYALGPVTGDRVVALGKLADFTCQVRPSSCTLPPVTVGGGAASDCFNAAMLQVGATSELNYGVSGSATGQLSFVGSVRGPVAFEGYANVLELVTQMTGSYTAPAALVAQGSASSQASSYLSLEGLDVLDYGGATSATVAGQTYSTVAVNTPPVRDKRFSLAVGASYTSSHQTRTVLNGTAVPGGGEISETTTYLGQESVSVAAGTFVACKFQEGMGASQSFTWIAKTLGVMVKSADTETGGSSTTMELLPGSRLNGVPIAPQ